MIIDLVQHKKLAAFNELDKDVQKVMRYLNSTDMPMLRQMSVCQAILCIQTKQILPDRDCNCIYHKLEEAKIYKQNS